MLKAFAFLRHLEIAIPPTEGLHHTLFIAVHGTENALCVHSQGKQQTLYLDAEDLACTPTQLVSKVKQIMEEE